MKKTMSIAVIFLLFLVACDNKKEVDENIMVHENIDEQMAIDTIKALDILEKKIRKNKKLEFEEGDAEFLNEYIAIYSQKRADKEFSTDEYQVYINTNTLIFSFGPKALVDDSGNYINGTSNFDWQKENILDVIENGFVPNE